jgi:transposase
MLSQEAEMGKAISIRLTTEEKAKLEFTIRSATAPVRDVLRSRIVWLAAQGKSNQEIAVQLGIHRHSAALWRQRFAQQGLRGLEEKTRRGRKKLYEAEAVETIIDTTLSTKPRNATHWSTRTLAESVGTSHSTVHRIWSAHQIKPHLIRTFKLSKDPHFTEKLRDVVGLYLNPPEHALVWSVDEKSGIQALDRTQPGLPLKKGRCGTMTHDYKRHGTTTLFAALNVLEGEVIGSCMKRHRHQEFLKFLQLIDRRTPAELDLHLIVDNYATHKHPKVKEWLAKHPRFHFHFIPTSSSWLNAVERFFAELTEKRLRRGVFRSVLDLIDAIDAYLEERNQDPKPFLWTKTADEILDKLAPLYVKNV